MADAVVAPQVMVDPSDFRPESKAKEQFRIYDASNPRFNLVRETYRQMHVNQTYEYAKGQRQKWCKFDTKKMTMMDALYELNALIDDSDPDIDLPNSLHGFQTAERIRQLHPDQDWFHLTGLIHDIGKVLALWGTPQTPTWATVGDTFVTGCAPSPAVVFVDQFEENPDFKHPVYSTKYGMYEPNCGLNAVTMSWGHDEYLYHVLKHNNTTLPDEALYMIRFHSFYPWHTGNDYDYLCDNHDRQMLRWVREFNKFDLYSKCDEVPDVKALTPYYQGLIDKYCPGLLQW
jgi:inositol oxygenase